MERESTGRKILKYVINEQRMPVLFRNEIVHSEIIQNVKSAGFLSLSYDTANNRYTVKCFGGSTSLKKLSNITEDKEIIENFLNDAS